MEVIAIKFPKELYVCKLKTTWEKCLLDKTNEVFQLLMLVSKLS